MKDYPAPTGMKGDSHSIKAIIARNEFLDQETSVSIVCAEDESKVLLLKLDREACVGSCVYRYAVARCRIDTVSPEYCPDEVLSCNITWVRDECFNAEFPFDLSW